MRGEEDVEGRGYEPVEASISKKTPKGYFCGKS